MISFYIDNKPDIFNVCNEKKMSTATHSHVTNCTMVPVPKADWTITKTKHQEEKNLTQLKKHIDEY